MKSLIFDFLYFYCFHYLNRSFRRFELVWMSIHIYDRLRRFLWLVRTPHSICTRSQHSGPCVTRKQPIAKIRSNTSLIRFCDVLPPTLSGKLFIATIGIRGTKYYSIRRFLCIKLSKPKSWRQCGRGCLRKFNTGLVSLGCTGRDDISKQFASRDFRPRWIYTWVAVKLPLASPHSILCNDSHMEQNGVTNCKQN